MSKIYPFILFLVLTLLLSCQEEAPSMANDTHSLKLSVYASTSAEPSAIPVSGGEFQIQQLLVSINEVEVEYGVDYDGDEDTEDNDNMEGGEEEQETKLPGNHVVDLMKHSVFLDTLTIKEGRPLYVEYEFTPIDAPPFEGASIYMQAVFTGENGQRRNVTIRADYKGEFEHTFTTRELIAIEKSGKLNFIFDMNTLFSGVEFAKAAVRENGVRLDKDQNALLMQAFMAQIPKSLSVSAEK